MATTATAAAGEAGDDDVEKGDNAVDDGGQHSAYAIDNGHQAVAYSAEDGFELEPEEFSGWASLETVCFWVLQWRNLRKRRRLPF
jgi:hypothetical protein